MVCFLINVPLMYHLAQPRCLEAWRGPGAGMRTRFWGRNANPFWDRNVDPILDRLAITNRAAQNRVRNPAHARRRIGFGSGPECGTDSEPNFGPDSGPNCRHDSAVARVPEGWLRIVGSGIRSCDPTWCGVRSWVPTWAVPSGTLMVH